MRKCKQNQCAFLRLGQGCRRCSFCSAEPFIVADDCPTCYNCENIPDSCRWNEDNNNDVVEIQPEKEKEKEEKPIEVEAK